MYVQFTSLRLLLTISLFITVIYPHVIIISHTHISFPQNRNLKGPNKRRVFLTLSFLLASWRIGMSFILQLPAQDYAYVLAPEGWNLELHNSEQRERLYTPLPRLF